MFASLPPEIVLDIVSYLHALDVPSLQLVSHAWNDFVLLNQETIYRNASTRHGFAHAHETLEDVYNRSQRERRWLGSMDSWREYCIRNYKLESNWLHGRVTSRSLPDAETVHRIKVDEIEETVITTHSDRALSVFCLHTGKLLWNIRHSKGWSHLEYGDGYVIFDRIGAGLEVWRRATDFEPNGPTECANSPPDRIMYLMQSAAVAFTGSNLRGHYRPWALLISPAQPRAFRCVGRELLVGSEEQRCVFIWDVAEGQLLQTIQVAVDPVDLRFHINYVELGQKYAFMCTSYFLYILRREDGSTHRFPCDTPQAQAYVKVKEVEAPGPGPTTLEAVEYDGISTTDLCPGHWGAVHISHDGKHLAMISRTGLFLLIKDWETMMFGHCPLEATSTCIYPQSGPVKHLAYEHGRVCITTDTEIIMISLDEKQHDVRLYPEERSDSRRRLPLNVHPGLRMLRLRGGLVVEHPLHGSPVGDELSCVQMTRSGVYLAVRNHAGSANSVIELRLAPVCLPPGADVV